MYGGSGASPSKSRYGSIGALKRTTKVASPAWLTTSAERLPSGRSNKIWVTLRPPTSASQVRSSSLRSSNSSALPPLGLRPRRRALITLVSLATSKSPGRRNSGSS
jgi:hypothetical protein